MHVPLPEFLRFCLVGGITFLCDALLLELLVHGGVATALARIASLCVALQVSYLLHGAVTYRGHRGFTRATWLQFIGSNLVGALINYGLFLLVVTLVPFAEARLTRLCGMVIGTAISMGFNYWANKRFAFARKESL